MTGHDRGYAAMVGEGFDGGLSKDGIKNAVWGVGVDEVPLRRDEGFFIPR